MSIELSNEDVGALVAQARAVAADLVHRMRLPWHELDDLCQDLLVDAIGRLASFDPDRGTLGGFAATVFAHRASRLAAKAYRERAFLAPITLDGPVPGTDGGTLAGTIAESGGLAALLGGHEDVGLRLQRRLAIERGVQLLGEPERALCAALTEKTPTEIGEEGPASRATVYRQVADIRLSLMAAGVSSVA
jgi:DNA-directed RNA polymerase specialized sigma24 family protein